MAAGAVAATLAWSAAAAAVDDSDVGGRLARPAPFAGRALRLGAGTGVALGLSDIEERSSDVIEVTSSAYRWNLQLAPSYQVADAWAVGLRGSWSSDAGARSSVSSDGPEVALRRSLWQLLAEARYQPGGPLGPYVAAGGGAALAVDSAGSASASQWAPALNGALGYDLGIVEPLAIGVELRGGVAWFGDDGASLARGAEVTRFVYGTSSWLGVNVVAQLCF